LIAGDADRAAFTSGALACLWTAAVLVMKALVAEARYVVGERPHPPAVPLKLLSAALTAGGASLAGMAGGHSVPSALILAALGAAGHLAFYGRDLRPRRITVVAAEGIDRAAVIRQLEQAHQRLRGIEAAGRSIPLPEFRERLSRIGGIGHSILDEIEREPADAARARRFLNVYLDSAEQVTREYARTHTDMRSQPLEENFRQQLTEMESTFAEQRRRLVERDLLALDVDIEVLNARLRGEGPG
jgi:5-bromo-4-chloroindolyl phosphate hydrolysis protein